MNVLRILKKLGWFITLYDLECWRLFELHRLEKSESPLLVKTRIPIEDLPQDMLFPYPRNLSLVSSRLPLGPSSVSTPVTSDSPLLVTVHSFDGQLKASFYGTPILLVETVTAYLMPGTSTATSPKKSRRSFRKKGSSSPSSDLLPENTLNTSPVTTKSSSRVIPAPGESLTRDPHLPAPESFRR